MVSSEPCRGWVGHVIVCGLEGVGFRTVEQLHLAGARVVVVHDRPDDRLDRVISQWGIPHITGNARTGIALHEAGIEGALAVVCVERDDLLTLETALLVHELRPDVRLVVQLANSAVGEAVDQIIGHGSVLDVADLASPAILNACIPDTVHEIELEGTPFAIAEFQADRHATLRSLYGDLAPVAVVPDGATDVEVCPGRDFPVAPGDHVTLLGTRDLFTRAGLPLSTSATESKKRRPELTTHLTHLGRHFSAVLRDKNERSLQLALLAAFSLVVISTLVVWDTYRPVGGGHLTFLDSLYFTVETVATVGFGDFSFAKQSPGLETFGIFLILAGVTILTTVFALFTNLLVSRRVEQSLGRQHIVGMSGHVVVIGLGSIGLRVVEGLLAKKMDVVVIERSENNRFLGHARKVGIPVIHGDASQRSVLESANVGAASAVAVLTSDDLTNIETGLAVRGALGHRWESVPVVLRVFDRPLGRTMERSFGFRHVRSTSALGAPWFAGAALGLEVQATFYVEQVPFLVGCLTVDPNGGLVGLSMKELSANTRVIALARAADAYRMEHPPRRETRFAAGDRAYLVGPYEELLDVLRRARASTAHDLSSSTTFDPQP